MDSLVLRERLETMVLREMLVPLVLLDLLVPLDLRFVNSYIHTSLYYVNVQKIPFFRVNIRSLYGYIACYWFSFVDRNYAVSFFRVPLETLALREPADPVDPL